MYFSVNHDLNSIEIDKSPVEPSAENSQKIIKNVVKAFTKKLIYTSYITSDIHLGYDNIAFNNMLLTYLPEDLFTGCSKLLYLNLSHNKLTTLPEKILHNCPQLRSLYLYNNDIESLPDGLFAECNNITALSLSCNPRLKLIPENILQKCSKLYTCYVDAHLYLTILPYVNDLHNLHTEPELSAKLCARIMKFRRNPYNANTYGWNVRREAIIGMDINDK